MRRVGMMLALSLAPALGVLGAVCGSAAAAEPPPACAYLSGLIPIDGGPLFLPSYPTAEPGPLRGAAFVYDDAVAALALIGCGELGPARRIGDAFLAALDHDRFWHDGRLRNGYAAGPATQSPARLGGWWDATQNRWLEDRYQVGSDSGNLAWGALALTTLSRRTGDRRYLDGALRLGAWLAGRLDSRGAGGYTGGFSGWEPTPTADLWKSTEHNTDIAAVFALLFDVTGDSAWAGRAEIARRFVLAMWDDRRQCFAAGVGTDGVTPNPIIALDAEIWPLLAVPGLAPAHEAAIADILAAHLARGGGYGYSDGGTGLWTEGTAQAALFARLSGDSARADALIRIAEAQRAPGGGYFATPEPSLDTGFADAASPGQQRRYFHLPHLAAAAWIALAETGFNPFTDGQPLPGGSAASP